MGKGKIMATLLRQITEVQARDDYGLLVSFDTGGRGLFGMRPYLKYPCYSKLRNPGYFSLAKPERGTVV